MSVSRLPEKPSNLLLKLRFLVLPVELSALALITPSADPDADAPAVQPVSNADRALDSLLSIPSISSVNSDDCSCSMPLSLVAPSRASIRSFTAAAALAAGTSLPALPEDAMQLQQCYTTSNTPLATVQRSPL